MNKFTSIESLRNVVKSVHHHCHKHGKPVPTIRYTGTVKLHGTNAGVRVENGQVIPQSRERVLTLESDNFGFAAFALRKDRSDFFIELARAIAEFNGTPDAPVTIYGEWIGPGIQRGVGVSNLPNRQFVMFSTMVGEEYIPDLLFSLAIDRDHESMGIYYINKVPTYSVDIDFTNPQLAADLITQYTLEVEKRCPWAAAFGIEGIGEGIVWVPHSVEYAAFTDLWFKSKGLEHKQNHEKTKSVNFNTEKFNEINALVDNILPQWRLEQGLSWMRENGIIIEIKTIGEYLKWVNGDVIKEEQDTITESGIAWKEVSRVVTSRARQFYLKFLETNE